eukprot:TRINITY_DN19558_c0_g1_i3.p2 TRINITY_DN19558_c0_g1~~TRINITY_DN19558_c0_g1_i3.p2  ORF type:complete len:149 (-),score=3.27 TRINITY_DN19558_c0_g1_i3:370-816(-)
MPNTTTIASNSADGKPGNGDSPIEQGEKIAISFNGKWVAFSTKASNLGVPSANIVMHNMIAGENKAISTIVGSNVGRPSISGSGSYVVFGIGGKLDNRFQSSGAFANFTGVGPCLSCPEQPISKASNKSIQFNPTDTIPLYVLKRYAS